MRVPEGEFKVEPRFEADLARLRARVNLTELVGSSRRREVDEIKWAIDPWMLGKEAVAMHQLIRARFRDRLPVETADSVRTAALVDARAWESLAGLDQGPSSFGAFINSAVAYELAGYQANAACVARAAERKVGRRNAAQFDVTASAFIQRQFLRVAGLAELLAQPPTPASMANGVALDAVTADESDPTAGMSDDDLAILAAQAFGGQALLSASLYFLSGESSHLDQAFQRLAVADEGFRATGAIREANLVANLMSLIPVMQARSTWATLADFLPGNPRWRRYLQVLARGIGDTPRDSRSVSELWPSQFTALNGGLLSSDDTMIVRMPTSAGKTRVAELAIVKTLLVQPSKTCLYIAPFRALADEVESSLDTILGDVGFAATSLIGGPESLGIEELLASSSQILVLTPEKADLLLRSRADLMDKVALIILDEGQIVGDEHRGAQFELLITRLRLRLPDARFLFLSAVIPEQTLQDFAQWLHAPADSGIIQSRWRPAIQRIASFEWTAGGGTLRYRRSSEGATELEAFARFLPRLVPEREYTYINPDSGRRNTKRFPDPTNRSHLIAALAYEFVHTGPVLMFCPQTNFAESCASALSHRVDLALRTDESVPPVFQRTRYPSADVAARWLGPDDTITRLLQRGIGVHHGRLPDAVRRAVESDFRSGDLRVLAATNTLAQGVNLPVRTVLVHSVRRRDEDGNEIRLDARDYWNVAGRAGRAGFETDGLTVHLTLNSRDREDLRFYLDRAENVEHVESSLLRILDHLVARRISTPQALAELDAGLMALLVEEGETQLAATVERVDPLLRASLVGVQANRTRRDMEPLVSVARDGAATIVRDISFADLTIYAKTGLTSQSCSHLGRHIVGNGPQLSELLVEPAPSEELIALMLDALSGLSEMQPRRSYEGSYPTLTLEWMSGRSIPEMVRRLTAAGETSQDVATIGRAVEEIASFLFPWGFSAYLQLSCHLLDVTASQEVMALPGLVRYGVPQAVAAWLMGFGITDRVTAIRVAAAFAQATTTRDGGPEAVRDWLAQQDPLIMTTVLGGSGDMLTDLARTIGRTRRSSLAQELDKALLPRSGWVVVPADPTKRLAVAGMSAGRELTIRRDHETTVNRNSVVVFYDGQEIGLLDGASADLLALEIDAGLELQVVATSSWADDSQRFEVRLDRAPRRDPEPER